MAIFYGFIFLTIFLLIILLLIAILVCIYMYFHASWDIMHYEIDMSNLRVIRLNKKNAYFATNLDVKKTTVGMFKYGSLKEFLAYFEPDTQINLNKFLDNPFNHKETHELDIKFNNFVIKKYHFITWFIFKLESYFLKKHVVKMTIRSIAANKFFCTITWKKVFSKKQIFKIPDLSDKASEIAWKNFVVIGGLLKLEKYNAIFYKNEISLIIKSLGLKGKNWKIVKDEDTLIFLVKKVSKYRFKHLLKKITTLNTQYGLNPFFDKFTIFRYPSLNTLYYKHNLKELLNYSLYNMIYSNSPNNYLNLNPTILKEEVFQTFSKNLNLYKTLNANALKFKLSRQKVINTYLTNDKVNLSLVKVSITNELIKQEWIDFFDLIPTLAYKYQNLWFDYVDSYAKEENLNLIYKIQQADFLRNDFLIDGAKVMCLLTSQGDYFDYKKINNKIAIYSNNNYEYGIYLTNINKSIYNLINSLNNLKLIVLSKDICNNLKMWNIIFSCYRLLQLTKAKNILVIYETIPQGLEDLIYCKLDLKYTLDIMDQKIPTKL